ncbi:unnamed protein product [Cladocopium goreaui]|uniref:Uncharacterized protein n=1 Tax=Cladocopium goreaui TaxID=2562237 RepID=A0A9P1D0Y4_9DINO|nr:unnamed protein product [Cladocopium goreaui]|mmetsp:Transcript_57666/g.126230  ORF Transcript_57666/g.126230 Transcript_57666/m.126230 type:complete len:184 (+) Transcript_57666:37-588(+)
MAWLNVQAASRKPGSGDGDVLNRLHLGRGLQSLQGDKAPETAGKVDAFAPPVKPRGGGISALAAAASEAALRPAKGPTTTAPPAPVLGRYGLPAWIKEDAVVLYRSSSGKEMKVMVKQVTPEKVKILFTDGKTWKGFSHSQILAKDGPLRQRISSSIDGRNRSRSPPPKVLVTVSDEVEVLDD